MRKIILLLLILFASVGMACSSMPSWTNDPYSGYSKADFICAVGFGKTQAEADMEAKKEIAGFFGTSVSANTEVSSSESSSSGFSSSFSSKASAQVNADDIVGIEIDKRYSEGKQFVSHAVLEKKSAITFYAGQIMNYITKTTNSEGFIKEDMGSMYALADLSDLVEAYNGYQKSLRIYNALSSTPFVSVLTEVPDISLISQQVFSSIEVTVKVSGDVDGRIESAIKAFLTECGLSIARRRSRNVVDVSITLEESEVKGNPYKFCRYSMKVSIVDETFEEQVFEFSASGKEGQNSYDQAKTRAVNTLEKMFKNEFADKFEEKFGIRPNK